MPPRERKRTPTPKQLEAMAKARAAARARGEATGFTAQREGAKKRWDAKREAALASLPDPAPVVVRRVVEAPAPPPAPALEPPPGAHAEPAPPPASRPTPLNDLRRLGGMFRRGAKPDPDP